jgi:hypothetical protein
MTANELADKLINSLTMEYDCDKYMEQAATMLRQQAQEIEALHNLVKEQDMKIINLSFDVAYANRTIELLNKESE